MKVISRALVDGFFKRRSTALAKLQRRLGYQFETLASQEVLYEALTHRSITNEYPSLDNERLELLGDSALGLATVEALLREYPDAHEGDLTELKIAMTNNEFLAQRAEQMDLEDIVCVSRNLREHEQEGGPLLQSARTRILSGTLEAIIGAVFTCGGYESAASAVRSVIYYEESPHLAKRMRDTNRSELSKDKLYQRMCTGRNERRNVKIDYKVKSKKGVDHSPEFHVICTVSVDGSVVITGDGIGKSKKNAERMAAVDALRTIDHSKMEF